MVAVVEVLVAVVEVVEVTKNENINNKKILRLTGVLQKLGFSACLNIWNSNEHCAKFEHSYF